jgi:transposase
MERRDLKDILHRLVEISSLPLKQIETDFAIDSTCFGTSRYTTYFDVRYNQKKDKQARLWRKCHAVCGVKSNIIVSIDVTSGNVNDMTRFIPLAEDTSRNFKIRDFLGDKGYLSGENFFKIRELGGKAFIPFKSNTTGNSNSPSKHRSYFKQAFRFFKEHQEEYLNHYHKRSNIESCFSSIKRRFGNNIRCKKEISQDNEILSKVLAYNICILVQELFLNKIDLNFMKHKENYIER